MKRLINPSNIVDWAKGVIELDPYSVFFPLAMYKYGNNSMFINSTGEDKFPT